MVKVLSVNGKIPLVDGKAISATGDGGVQPDWNQNDATQPDYVKNRPFYSETANVTVENVRDSVLEGFPTFVAGDTITVNVDGVEHSLVAYEDDGYATIGDTYNSIDSGEGQFGWQIFVDGESVHFNATEAHTVSYLGTIYHTIDKKYLPTATMGISLNASIEQLIEAEEHYMANGVLYLANRLVLSIVGNLPTIGQATFYTQDAAFTFKSDGTLIKSYTLENNVRHNSNGSPNGIILNSKDSSKQFLITVDDSGTISATEVTA